MPWLFHKCCGCCRDIEKERRLEEAAADEETYGRRVEVLRYATSDTISIPRLNIRPGEAIAINFF